MAHLLEKYIKKYRKKSEINYKFPVARKEDPKSRFFRKEILSLHGVAKNFFECAFVWGVCYW